MSFAELFLRIGCGLVGWLLIYAHALLLAVVPQADCSRELFSTTLLFAVFALVAAGLLQGSLHWRSALRWCLVPVVPLWLLGLGVAFGLWETAAATAPTLCDALAGNTEVTERAGWERAWVPAQLGAILACAVSGARYWTTPDAKAAP
ncbi:MAG: hypothetical protein AAF430_15710 [Myxococcota bacterium]